MRERTPPRTRSERWFQKTNLSTEPTGRFQRKKKNPVVSRVPRQCDPLDLTPDVPTLDRGLADFNSEKDSQVLTLLCSLYSTVRQSDDPEKEIPCRPAPCLI